jgi:hypothetical protein
MECFTLGIKANVKPKSSNPIHAKKLTSPKGLTIGIKVSKKTFHPTYSLMLDFMALYWPPRLIKGYHQSWDTKLQCMEPILLHL